MAAWQWNKPTVGRNVADARVGNGPGIVESGDRAQIDEVDAVEGDARRTVETSWLAVSVKG